MLTDASLARLAAVPFFASLAPHDLGRLAAQVRVVTAEPGEVLVREGEHGDRVHAQSAAGVSRRLDNRRHQLISF
jgi:CRP-like cAMP-binding protein